MRSRRIIFIGVFLATVIGLFAGCEDTFNPLKENERYYFSILGTLDASSDTQWVRVMPVRDSIFTSPEPLNVTVTITNKRTGEEVEMEDSLFSLREGYDAWNFWTTMDIEPGEEYFFRAINDEGASSTVDVFIPEEFPTPLVDYDFGDPVGRIYVDGVPKLAVADIVYYFRYTSGGVDSEQLYSDAFSQLEDVRVEFDGTQIVYTYPQEDIGMLRDRYTSNTVSIRRVKQEVLIVSGGPGWPDLEDLTEQERLLPGFVSNVENGLGVLAGIVSKRIPFESCYDSEGNLEACPVLRAKGKVKMFE